MVTERLPNRAAARAATLIGRVCTACRHFAQFYTKKLRKNSLGNYKSAALPTELCRAVPGLTGKIQSAGVERQLWVGHLRRKARRLLVPPTTVDLPSRDQSLAIEFLCTVAGDFSERCANVIPSLGGAPTRGVVSSVKACFALGRWPGTICTIAPSVTRLKSAATSLDLIRMQP